MDGGGVFHGNGLDCCHLITTFMTYKNVWIAMVVVTIIAIGGYFFPLVQSVLGSSGTRFPNGLSTNTTSPSVGELLTTTVQVGSSGTDITRINTGTCYIKAYATTIAASSTATVDCQATAAVGSISGATSALTGVTMG